ncbi:cytidine deaminase-like protein [Dipodascopsis tothii]|uniref:cytidine deaminase-like protein n=1 Tax=Dipodascopsis tothii TaxID=44089 RepID=UPI0034CFF8B1
MSTTGEEREIHRAHLRTTIQIARRAKNIGKHPFGCIIVGPDNDVLFTQGNIDTLNHAESTIVRTAWSNLSPDYLAKCTLYTNFEPCAMCAGSIYWSNVGRVVYGLPESRLLQLTGDDEENMTMSLDCRTVLSSGQKSIAVIGPFEELADEIIEDHKSFWNH